MELAEKRKIGDIIVGVLIGASLGYLDRDREDLVATTVIFLMCLHIAKAYVICRFIVTSAIWSRWFLGMCLGWTAVGFYEIRMGCEGGLASVVSGLGLAIGAMLARRALAKKASRT